MCLKHSDRKRPALEGRVLFFPGILITLWQLGRKDNFKQQQQNVVIKPLLLRT